MPTVHAPYPLFVGLPVHAKVLAIAAMRRFPSALAMMARPSTDRTAATRAELAAHGYLRIGYFLTA